MPGHCVLPKRSAFVQGLQLSLNLVERLLLISVSFGSSPGPSEQRDSLQTPRLQKGGVLSQLVGICLPPHTLPLPSGRCKPEPTSQRMSGLPRSSPRHSSPWSCFVHVNICSAVTACDAISLPKFMCRPMSGLVIYKSKA